MHRRLGSVPITSLQNQLVPQPNRVLLYHTGLESEGDGFIQGNNRLTLHGLPEKKILYAVFFQKKYVGKGTKTPKNRKENLFFVLMYRPTLTKNFFFFIISQAMCSLILTFEISFLYLQPGTLHFSFLSEFFL